MLFFRTSHSSVATIAGNHLAPNLALLGGMIVIRGPSGGRRVVRQDFGRCNDVELADDVVPCWGAKHIFAGRALRMRGGGEAAALLCIQWLWAGRILAAIPIFLQWLPAILHGCSMQMAALHRWGSEVTLQWGTHVESSRVNGTFGASS